jgi:hypothetical protein
MRRSILIGLMLAAAGCYSSTPTDGGTPPTPPPAPSNLTYELIPSGESGNPVGVLLRWDPPVVAVNTYNVYSRSVATGTWGLRATTTSASFYDLGTPDLQYMVTSADATGLESAGSNAVTVDLNPPLPAPTGLFSVSLNGAIQLSWNPNARNAAPALFAYYRVYSSLYDLDNNLCSAQWFLEGTTVSDDFISSGLTNGVPMCFAVSAVTLNGQESQWTVPRADTPRYDARNVLINAVQTVAASSGFIFYSPTLSQFGIVTSGTRTDLDFNVDRHGDGSLWLRPVRAGTGVTLWGPVGDLTEIDFAPNVAYSTSEIQAVVGNGYVFETTQTDGVHFGGVRVTAAGAGYIIVDWSYQSDFGNPELRRVRP